MSKPATMEYRVMYKSNGVTPDEGRGPVKPGMHARFVAEEGEDDGAVEDAKEELEKCKKFFNENTTCKIELDEEGFSKERKEVFTTKVKEIVHVWIDIYRDGTKIHNGDPTCEQDQSEETEPATSSTAKRSRKLATTAAE